MILITILNFLVLIYQFLVFVNYYEIRIPIAERTNYFSKNFLYFYIINIIIFFTLAVTGGFMLFGGTFNSIFVGILYIVTFGTFVWNNFQTKNKKRILLIDMLCFGSMFATLLINNAPIL